MLRPLRLWGAALALCLAPALALAQGFTCPNIVETALEVVDQFCAKTGRNQVCYGSVRLAAEPKPGVEDFEFRKTGDLISVADLQNLRASAMNVEAGEWGVALMRLQANLPDTLPGQNVTFILFGDVELTPVEPADPNAPPMQAFYLRTGVGDARCEEAPESGLLVQTPEGAGEVAFNVNGVDVQMGSTVFFQADEDEGMTVSTLEGLAYVRANGGEQIIVPGTWVRVALSRLPDVVAGFKPRGLPELPRAYEARTRMLERLPVRLLQRRIEIAPPLAGESLQRLLDKIHAGGPLCGETPLPACRPPLLPVRPTALPALPVRPTELPTPPALPTLPALPTEPPAPPSLPELPTLPFDPGGMLPGSRGG
ncbi:MAG: hypothetical protein HXY41_17190 [Chloroflexi bacterium]|nr:hypothetical protein [Chloroflexota bacterium]